MNKAKFILLFVVGIIFLTGCNIDYKAEFTSDNKVKETIKITFRPEICYESNEANPPSSCEEYVNNKLDVYYERNKEPIYKLDVDETENNVKVLLEYNYESLEDFKDSNSHSPYFSESNFDGNKFEYRGLGIAPEYMNDVGTGQQLSTKNLKIKIISDKIIKDSNAEKKDDARGIYEWNLTSKDDGESIYFIFADKENLQKKYFSQNPIMYYIVIGLIILFIMLLIAYFFYSKYRKSNKI